MLSGVPWALASAGSLNVTGIGNPRHACFRIFGLRTRTQLGSSSETQARSCIGGKVAGMIAGWNGSKSYLIFLSAVQSRFIMLKVNNRFKAKYNPVPDSARAGLSVKILAPQIFEYD